MHRWSWKLFMDRLLAAVLNHRRTGNPEVLLTTVGGAFGSERERFIGTLRALRCMHNRPLEVAIGPERQRDARRSSASCEAVKFAPASSPDRWSVA